MNIINSKYNVIIILVYYCISFSYQYPIIIQRIYKHLPVNIKLLTQIGIVAEHARTMSDPINLSINK